MPSRPKLTCSNSTVISLQHPCLISRPNTGILSSTLTRATLWWCLLRPRSSTSSLLLPSCSNNSHHRKVKKQQKRRSCGPLQDHRNSRSHWLMTLWMVCGHHSNRIRKIATRKLVNNGNLKVLVLMKTLKPSRPNWKKLRKSIKRTKTSTKRPSKRAWIKWKK